MAPGDLAECFLQSLAGPVTGINFSRDLDEVTQIVRIINDAYAQETPANGMKNYFIVVAHSQGNFFAEGVGDRLRRPNPQTDSSLAQTNGPYIFNNRFGIVSLGSPTRYNDLPADFVATKLRHITRADDGIHVLDSIIEAINSDLGPVGWLAPFVNRGLVKRPFPREQDVNALWPWTSFFLYRVFSTKEGLDIVPDYFGQGLAPLATPFMNAHLLDNYLTTPTATSVMLTGSERDLPQKIATRLTSYWLSPINGKPQTPQGTLVFFDVQQAVRDVKQALLAGSR
jgi:hypothetical protein